MSVQNLEHPQGRLPEHHKLDPNKPIERLLIEYVTAVATDSLNPASEDRNLAGGVQAGDMLAQRKLIRAHRGLIAAIIYTSGLATGNEKILLQHGAQELIKAAKDYDTKGDEDFTDVAITAIQDYIGLRHPPFAEEEEMRPTERLLAQIGGLAFSAVPTAINQEAESTLSSQPTQTILMEEIESPPDPFEGLTLMEEAVAKLLYLPEKDISNHEEFTAHVNPTTDLGFARNNAMTRIKNKLHMQRRNPTAFALEFRARGYKYPVKDPGKPLKEIFTKEELKIGHLLGKSNKEIASKVKIKCKSTVPPSKAVANKVHVMCKKLGAQTRTELALVIAEYSVTS